MNQRAGASVLGKGLSALMSDSYPLDDDQAEVANDLSDHTGAGLETLSVGQLKAGRFQPRHHFEDNYLQELADSIRKNGIMQPITVRTVEGQVGYEIIAGERRWRAAKLAGLTEVPVIIRDVSDQVALEFALVENIQRQDLSPLEEAQGYQQLIEEFNYTQDQLAKTIGKSRSHIANLIRLLSLPQAIKDLLDQDALSMGHARALLGVQNPTSLAEQIIRKGLSVRETEVLARNEGGEGKASRARVKTEKPAGSKPPKEKDPDILALEETLSQNLGLPVSIDNSGSRGTLMINYNSLEQLDKVLRHLSGNL